MKKGLITVSIGLIIIMFVSSCGSGSKKGAWSDGDKSTFQQWVDV